MRDVLTEDGDFLFSKRVSTATRSEIERMTYKDEERLEHIEK